MEALLTDGAGVDSARDIITHPLYAPSSSPWLDLKVFYVRISNCQLDDHTPEYLTLNHVPLSLDTVIELNGRRSSIYTECTSSSIRRDKVDRKSVEVTFVSTDSIKMTGSTRFEVFDKSNLLLTVDLEISTVNGIAGESKSSKKWNIKCQQEVANYGFLKGRQSTSRDGKPPMIEVYIAGSFFGTPIILTKMIHVGTGRKKSVKFKLDSIPEDMTQQQQKLSSSEGSPQVAEPEQYRQEMDVNVDYNSLYPTPGYFGEEDGELSWFNAGVRVGVGIGLGICLGVGLGVGLMVRTYQGAKRNFRLRR